MNVWHPTPIYTNNHIALLNYRSYVFAQTFTSNLKEAITEMSYASVSNRG